jgi:Tol biopolymer transport system component
VLASLNHPNVAAIYGLEESGTTPALVMELVEGPTLADSLAHGPIPLAEALPIAKQIAEALEAAHDQGVVHRDLKPANVKVRADGTVKVLDFGLAKALDPTPTGAAELANSPTLSMQATQAGVILGTAAYMSPEQARGTTVDKRTDLWAFGVVLFEMLTGHRLFEGATVSDSLAHVLTREPDWNALPATTPAPVRKLLRRCLEKDRKRRLADASDARLDIEDAVIAPPAAEAATRVGSAVGSSSDRRLAWSVATAATVLATGLAVPTLRHVYETPALIPQETRVDIVTPGAGNADRFALSPDGRSVVFVATGDGPTKLWMRTLRATTVQPLAGTDGADGPFWSPDSKSIAFIANGQLKRIDLDGGAPQTLASPAYSSGGTWNAEGVILFSSGVGALSRVSATGGSVATATTLAEGQAVHNFPVFLPDGHHFLLAAPSTGIYLGTLDRSTTTRLTKADSPGWYLPGGWLLRTRGQTLVAERLDLNRQMVTGDPIVVAEPVAMAGGLGGLVKTPAVSVSATGLVAYRAGTATRQQLTWFDRTGKTLGTLGPPDDDLSGMSISPDGLRAAVVREGQGNTHLWLIDRVRSTRLTFGAGLDGYPLWSPDGQRIVFSSTRTGLLNLYEKPTSGAGTEVVLVDTPQTKLPNDWSRDGRFLLYHSIDPKTSRDLWVRPMESGGTPWSLLKTPFDERWGQFSPDGRWVAYQSNESGQFEIYVRPFVVKTSGGTSGAPGSQWQVSTLGGSYPRWRSDGRELYYLAPAGDLMAAPIAARGATLDPGTPVALFRPPIVGGGIDSSQGWQYDVSRDGRFLINTVLDTARPAPITLIQHWNPPEK